MGKTREGAWNLLNKYVDSESLIKHSLAVEAAMRAYAKKYSESEEKWGICGLLHDFDYEKWPETHPKKGVQILKEENYPEDIIEAIESHVDGTGVERNILMAKTLYAVDELSGLIYALAHIRPTNLEGMKPKSVKKALKKKGFAAGVNREDIERGIKELEIEKSEHFEIVIKALQEISSELGF